MAIKSNPETINRYRLLDAEYYGSCNSSCFFASVSTNKSNVRHIMLVPKEEGTDDFKSSGEILKAITDNPNAYRNQQYEAINDMRSMQELMKLQGRTRLVRTKSV